MSGIAILIILEGHGCHWHTMATLRHRKVSLSEGLGWDNLNKAVTGSDTNLSSISGGTHPCHGFRVDDRQIYGV